MRAPLLCLVVLFCSATLAQAATLSQQRHIYDEAERALDKGDSGPYLRNKSLLAGYPLEPYLAYDELTARLKSASNAEVASFLQRHGDLPQINWMKLRWLRLLAQRGDWQPFVAHYSEKLNFTELDCLYGQYLLGSGKTAEGNALTERLWLVGKSQPDACDPLFERWAAAGQLTEQRRWDRLKLAAEAGNYGLANYLVKTLNALQSRGQLLIDTARNPALLTNQARYVGRDEAMGDVVGLGLRRLARKDPEQALALLDGYASRMDFSASERLAIARTIGLTLARRFDPRALTVMERYDPQLHDDTVSEWRARLLLRLGRWNEAYQLTQRMPEELAQSNRWRYWSARALQMAQPQSAKATQLLQPVSSERDFYGFLAADQLKVPYALNNRPVEVSRTTLNKVRNTPAIQRAMEFHARGEIVDARREWYHVARHFDNDELLAQARIAYEMQWYFPAIRSISQAKYWDDLDIRFPMAYRDDLVRQAQLRGLHSSWVFAITRQESAFMADARSHAGAMGLMQLMPATAKETAKRFGIPLSNPNNVLLPSTNIQLGAAYLSQVHAQFNGNRVLASAAYNAGAGRVRQWLRDARHLPFDVWVESIPFDETRQYVQNVLSYAVIYGQKLGNPQPIVDWHERFFDGLMPTQASTP